MMKKDEVQVGGTYLAKVGTRHVEVRIEGETPKGGWNAKSVASGKPIRIKDPRHLRPVDAADSDTAKGAEPEIEQPAPPDDADLVPLTQLDKEKKRHGGKKAKAPKASKTPKAEKAPKEKPAKEKAPRPMSALDAAAAVLKAKGEPMRCAELIGEMKQRGLWESNAPTPAATLSSALLREITTKGADSRFEKADRGLFALRGN
jgi:hypothetical protein